MYRSMLFVPGDSEKKIAKSTQVAPDIVILDLEDSVAPGNKALARATVTDYLIANRGIRPAALFVRINPLGTAEATSCPWDRLPVPFALRPLPWLSPGSSLS